MKALYELVIEYVNGSSDRLPFNQYDACRDKFIWGISYSGGRVKRVEVHMSDGSIRAIWDISWDDQSKFAGLYH